MLTQMLQPLHRLLTCKVALNRKRAFCRQMATQAPQMPHTSGLIVIMQQAPSFLIGYP